MKLPRIYQKKTARRFYSKNLHISGICLNFAVTTNKCSPYDNSCQPHIRYRVQILDGRRTYSPYYSLSIVAKGYHKVEIRPHEYSNSQRDTLSVFRIDFGATVREADGSEHLILIELQKTWLPTETLRFRQYLGVQYENPNNMVGDKTDQHALPMVAVYLLGHKVGDIEEPVLYVRHQSYDYGGNIVTKGLPNEFVDSLTHDSIIVQIPRLHGQINNRLDKVLSIFDQTRKDSNNQQILNIDDSLYPEDDVEMQRILHRLLMAATDADMRMDMNVEDEYFSIIEMRDTEIMQKTRELAEKNVQLAEKNDQLAEKNVQLAKKDDQLAKKDDQLAKKTVQLEEQQALLKSTIRLLLDAGKSLEEIAKNLGKDLEEVKLLAN